MSTNDAKPGSAASQITAEGDLSTQADQLLSLISADDDPEAEVEQPADGDDKGETPEADAGDTSESVSDDAETDEPAADEGEPEKEGAEQTFAVKVDGEEVQVPLSELLNGYSARRTTRGKPRPLPTTGAHLMPRRSRAPRSTRQKSGVWQISPRW